jgi:hypothetical protein
MYTDTHAATTTKRQRDSECHVCTLPFDDEDGKTEEAHICILKCGHHGHDICMQKWILKNPSCPICRHVDISCNHGCTLLDHRKHVLMDVISAQRTEIEDLKRDKQMVQDELIATNMVYGMLSPLMFVYDDY